MLALAFFYTRTSDQHRGPLSCYGAAGTTRVSVFAYVRSRQRFSPSTSADELMYEVLAMLLACDGNDKLV